MTILGGRQAIARDLLRTERDAAAALVVAAFRSAYAGLLDPAALERMTPEYLLEAWSLDSEAHLMGLFDESDLVGVCRIGAHPDSEALGHLYSLYVSPHAQGRGFGRQLLEAATEALRERGFKDATLWVFAGNERANALYTRNGWTSTDRERVEPEWGAREIELKRSLVRS